VGTALEGLLVVALPAAFAILCVLIVVKADRRAFHEKFPPITYDEFVARCAPGASRHVALTVRRIVAEHLGVEYDHVYPSMRFIEGIGTD
jgi:hypothetical protein